MVENDPAQALLSAQHEGLLTYHGFVSGNLYEVEAHGRHWKATPADALLTVARLRALDELVRAGSLIELVEIRADGAYALRLTGGDLVLPEAEVIHWTAGYSAARQGYGQKHAGEDQINVGDDPSKTVAALFDDPSLDDQCRMVILGLMHGGDEKVNADDLAERIGALPDVPRVPVKKTIVGALGFGRYLSADMREWMIRAFGHRWSLAGAPGGKPGRSGRLAPVEVYPEMPGLVRLRELVLASKAGWVHYLDKANPNTARWLPEYVVSVGAARHVVPAEALLPWLRGVRAFNETASVPKLR